MPALVPYGQSAMKFLNKEIDFDTDDIRVTLHTSAYVPNLDTHVYVSSLTNEVAGTGYTAGGISLASKTITYAGGATRKTVFDAADVTWAATITIADVRYIVVSDRTPGTAASQPLIGVIDLGSAQPISGGPFTVQWDATNGVFYVEAA